MSGPLETLLASISDVLFPEALGEAKVDIHSRSIDGDGALHVMIWRRDSEGARLLLENGADVNAVGDMGETPLHVAISRNDPVLIGLLLSYGARIDIRSEFGETALEKAGRCGANLADLFDAHIDS